jgi:hypothetical protein
MSDRPRRGMTVLSYLVVLTAFGIAMGYLEAVVVVYIREIMGIVPTPEQLDPEAMRQVPKWLIPIEQTREAATMIMLASVAMLAGRNNWQRLGTFTFVFGVWDIFYYVGLKALIDWPASLHTLDCLFLIPQPWYSPVWVPVAASCGLIALGVLFMRLGARRR